MDYYPDKWLIIKINGTDPHYRVFGSWSGGYADGDAWRLNSGIERIAECDRNYAFAGYSGSEYVCNKNTYGANLYGWGVATDLTKDGNSVILTEDEAMDWISTQLENGM